MLCSKCQNYRVAYIKGEKKKICIYGFNKCRLKVLELQKLDDYWQQVIKSKGDTNKLLKIAKEFNLYCESLEQEGKIKIERE